MEMIAIFTFILALQAAEPIEIKLKIEPNKQVNPLFSDRIFDLGEAGKGPPAPPRMEYYNKKKNRPLFDSPFSRSKLE